MRALQSLALIGLATMMAASCATPAPAPEPFKLKPVADVQEIMESLVAHMSQDVFDAVRVESDASGVHEIKPQTDQAWLEVRYAAKGLAETGNLLMIEGRAPDQENWAKYSQVLIDTSLEAARAADRKDFEGLMTAGGNIYLRSCVPCHEEYVPTFQAKRLAAATRGAAAPGPAAAPKP